MRNPVPRLYQLFSHEDRLLILIDPDPDSIASALALKRLLWHRLSACVISPIRPITRPQNQRLVDLLGITLNPIQQIHPEDRARVEEALLRNDRRREPTELEYRVLTADGHERWIHNRCVFSRVGRELTITGVMLDITERRRAEEALKEREEQVLGL